MPSNALIAWRLRDRLPVRDGYMSVPNTLLLSCKRQESSRHVRMPRRSDPDDPSGWVGMQLSNPPILFIESTEHFSISIHQVRRLFFVLIFIFAIFPQLTRYNRRADLQYNSRGLSSETQWGSQSFASGVLLQHRLVPRKSRTVPIPMANTTRSRRPKHAEMLSS